MLMHQHQTDKEHEEACSASEVQHAEKMLVVVCGLGVTNVVDRLEKAVL